VLIFLDENVGRRVAAALTADGHDVERAVEVLRSQPDETLLEHARETSRVLVTFDSDFVNLVFRDHKPPAPAIIYMRFQPRSQMEILDHLHEALAHQALIGSFVIVDRDGLRLRRLPPSSASA
jgi:predicted nuclease of predicted toxin-antitoxin system